MKKTPVDAAALSDRGLVRESNEDSVFLESPVSPSAHARGLLAIVADGMGGHVAGEIASHIAAQSVRARYYQSPNPYIVESLQESMEAANAEVWQESRRQAGRAGMGCTLTTAVIHDNHLVVGHVGDSRAYLVRGDSIVQITEDHSLVAEQVTEGELSPEAAKEHPQRNVITRAIGEKASVKIDIYEEELQGGDVVVLCTDGLTAVVSDEDIGQLVVNSSAKRAAEALVKLANERGAPDNVSVVVVRVGRAASTRFLNSVGKRALPVLGAAIALALLAAAFYAVIQLADSGQPAATGTIPPGTTVAAAAAGAAAATPAATPLPTARPVPTGGQVSVSEGALLRSAPRKDAPAVASIPFGVGVSIKSEQRGDEPAPGGGDLWYQVDVPTMNNQTGFMHSSVLNVNMPAATPASGQPPAATAAPAATPAPGATARP